MGPAGRPCPVLGSGEAEGQGEAQQQPPIRAGCPLLYELGSLTADGEWPGRGLQGETCAEGAAPKPG